MAVSKYSDILLEIQGQIGIIKLNRPERLNTFGGDLLIDVIDALRHLNENNDTVFTVITGMGRYFCAGGDVETIGLRRTTFKHAGDEKTSFLEKSAVPLEFVRSLIEHKKVLIVAMNGPGIGGGATWFQGTSDLLYMAEGSFLQATFSQLGLVAEVGCAIPWKQNLGVHRANEMLMFGEKQPAEQLHHDGFVNKLFPAEGFHDHVLLYLQDILKTRSGKSMVEVKRLQNKRTRDERILALFEATDALAEKFMEKDSELVNRMMANRAKITGRRRENKSKL